MLVITFEETCTSANDKAIETSENFKKELKEKDKAIKEIGNLTTDPNYGEKGDVKYCNFNVAINNPFNKEDTEFIQVSTFGKQAEACRDNLKKGLKYVLMELSRQQRIYQMTANLKQA